MNYKSNNAYYGYVYKFTCLTTNKYYVGKHKYSGEGLDPSYWGGGTIWSKVLKKYGKENIKREILEWCDTLEETNKCERKWIELLDARNSEFGYNITSGGDGYIHSHTQLEKDKISKGNKGKKRSESVKKHLSEINKGKTAHNKGKLTYYNQEGVIIYLNQGELPPEGFTKGIPPVTQKTRDKLSKVPRTKEWNRKNSEAHIGDKNAKPALGKKWFNNGVIERYSFECPEGFQKGRLKRYGKYSK